MPAAPEGQPATTTSSASPRARLGVVALATALGKSRKTVWRWSKRAGAPFDTQGEADVDELRAWAAAAGLLDLVQGEKQGGVGAALEGEAAPAHQPAPAAAPPPAPAAAPSSAAARPLELNDDDRLAISALEAGDGEQLVQLASKLSPDVIRRISATAKLRKDVADAEAKELAVRQAAGELVALKDVRAFWAAQRAVVTAAFQAAPGKLTPLLVQQDYDTIYGTLERELDAVLRALAREPLARG